MSDESAERIHPATPHHRQLARQQGYVAKSYDLPWAGVFLAGVLLLGGGDLFGALADCVRQPLSGATVVPTDARVAFEAGNSAFLRLGRSLALCCGGCLAVAVFGHLLQTGFQPQPQRLAPDLSRLDPLATAARMLSGDAAARQVLTLLKLAALGGVAAWAVWGQREEILALGGLPPVLLVSGLGELLSGICLKLGGVLVVVSAVDYGFQRWRYERSLQMTPEEVREETRNQTGDPGVQRRRRQTQRDLALGHLEASVAQAQLVLVQGDTLAVAIQYDGQAASAPLVVAKGRGDAAARIRQIAERAKIHIADEARLVQRIARQTTVGAPVAAEHYRALANVWHAPR